LEQKIGWLRDRIWAAIKGEPKGASDVAVAVESGLEALLREEGEKAAERAEAAWRANPAGRMLLDRAGADLRRVSEDYPSRAARAIRAWQGDVMELVSDEGSGRRTKARIAAFGVNGVGVALMLVAFAHTGGLVGAEVGVAGGTAVLAQRVLEAVFGDDAVRRLAKKAKDDLDARVEGLLAGELSRFHAALDAVGIDPPAAERIRTAAVAADEGRALEMHQLGLTAVGAGDTPVIAPYEREQVDLRQVDAPTAEVVDGEVLP
jgi:hypothetical protein